MLKFEALAKVGDTIKAFDFQPMPDREDRYVVGVVTARGMTKQGYVAYTISVTEDSAYERGMRREVYVPYETSFMDYDGRITLVETA